MGPGPGPYVGPVWTFLHNIVEPIDPISGSGPIIVQCEYTISVNSLNIVGGESRWNPISSIFDHFVTDIKLLRCKDRDKIIHLNSQK